MTVVTTKEPQEREPRKDPGAASPTVLKAVDLATEGDRHRAEQDTEGYWFPYSHATLQAVTDSIR